MQIICESVDVNVNECLLILKDGKYLVFVNNDFKFEMDELIVNDLNKLYGNSRFDLDDVERVKRAFHKFCCINLG